GLIERECLTVSGEKIGDIIEKAKIYNKDVIRDIENPYMKEGGIAILKGSLAPDGAVVKQSAVKENMRRFIGKAFVFNSEEEATKAVIEGKIKEGVIIIRYEGPKGGPGMREMLSITSIISGKGLDEKVALITDGRFSGGTRGPCIGHISPEAAEGGPIAYVKDGDIIEIDIPSRKIEIRIDEREMEKRKKEIKILKKDLKGVLEKYSKLVHSANTGGILK
ncbi:MAG: dihydroxy-acid dehydratase, partial [Candidatus Omnitrophica bacterium]|nr:dihydroxy-acid dehydratase [Candidatus Omnitrophota bacterium]